MANFDLSDDERLNDPMASVRDFEEFDQNVINRGVEMLNKGASGDEIYEYLTDISDGHAPKDELDVMMNIIENKSRIMGDQMRRPRRKRSEIEQMMDNDPYMKG